MSYQEKRERLEKLSLEDLLERVEALQDGGSGLVKEGLIDIILDVEGGDDSEVEGEGIEEDGYYSREEQELDIVDRLGNRDCYGQRG